MGGESFNFWNEKKATDLNDLVSILNEISYEEFATYVDGSKNDFASWIEYSLGNKILADKIRPLVEKDLLKVVISDFLKNQTNQLIISPGKGVLDDSLVKEVMMKNELFFKDVNNAESNKSDKKYDELKDSEFKFFENKEKNVDVHLKSNSTEFKNNSEVKEQNSAVDNVGGSKIAFIDAPKLKHHHKDLIIGLVFGIVIGILATLIVFQVVY